MTLSESEHAAPPPISLVPTAPTCDAEPMRIAVHGDAAFLQGWKEALERASDADVICLAATEHTCADLLIASDAASDLAMVGSDRYAAVVLVANSLDTLTCRKLQYPELVAIPPPRDEAGRKLVARWIVDHARRCARTPRSSRPLKIRTHISVDFRERSLVYDDETIRLSSGETALLRYLLEYAGVWISTSEVCAGAFGRKDVAAAKLVWKYVSTLRRKLGRDAALLETDRTHGYRLSLP